MKHVVNLLVVVSMVLFTTAHADDTMESLKLFKSGLQHGKWQMEILEGTDPKIASMMKQTGNMSICMDIAKQLAKDYQHDNNQSSSCTHKVIKDSANSAEVDVTCENGSHVHSLITRDNDKTYTAESTIATRDHGDRHMKFRYLYQGECSNDGVIQLDKNSPACKMMREKSQGRDMTAMCARLQDKMREQCEQNMKNAMASCQ